MKVFLILLTITVFAFADAFNDGLAAVNRGDWQEAVQHFTQAIKSDPNNAIAYNNRGYCYDELGDYSKAISDYTQAIKLDPKFAMAYYNRGVLYAELKDYKNAMQDAKKACELGDCDLLQELRKNGEGTGD